MPDPLAPKKQQSKPGSRSPGPSNGRKSPFRLASRGATSSVARREHSNPSVDLSLPQDCAFPIFPTSRSVTPTTPQEPKHPFKDSQNTNPKSTHIAPISASGKSSEDVIKKMNKMAPGPFDVDAQRRISLQSSHRRTGTVGSIRGAIESPDVTKGQSVPERPSTSSQNKSHDPATNSNAHAPTTDNSGDNQSASSRNGSYPLASEMKGGTLRSSSALGQTRTAGDTNRQLLRSQTFAAENRSRPMDFQGKHTRQQSSSTPAVSHLRRPSVAAANRPLDEIGSMSSYKPFRFATTVSDPATVLPVTHTNKHGAERSDPRAVDAPPVPLPIQTMGFNQANYSHSPTESRSSNGSSSSSVNTTRSSRSSPPLSEAGYPSRRKGSDTSRIDNLMVDLQATIAKETSFNAEAPPQNPARTVPPPSFSRPLYPRSPETSSKPGPPLPNMPESPTDPSMQFGRLSPLLPSPRRTPSPSKMAKSTAYAQNPSFHEPSAPRFAIPPQQPSLSASPTRRPTAANKGNCRGCGELIKGKSVSSADGRLTGRYHKDCFVCKTCKEPFKTADFYIMNNDPYCSRHYHQLNGSLCKSCDRGIEGQYLEAETKSKFHPACFTCRVSLHLKHGQVISRL